VGVAHAHLTGHSSSVYALALVSSTVLASALWDKSIKLWDLHTHTCLATLTGHSKWVSALALVSSTVLASASGDRTVKLWKLEWNPIMVYRTNSCGPIELGGTTSTSYVASTTNVFQRSPGDTDTTVSVDDFVRWCTYLLLAACSCSTPPPIH
jgi:WD40 repeat protein